MTPQVNIPRIAPPSIIRADLEFVIVLPLSSRHQTRTHFTISDVGMKTEMVFRGIYEEIYGLAGWRIIKE